MGQTLYPGPTPPYTNPTIHPEYYVPERYQISAITLGQTTTIQTSSAHDFVIGQQLRILIPATYGTRQLNEQSAYVISVPTTTSVVVDIDSSVNYDAFISSPTYGPTPPTVIPIGDINSGALNANGPSNMQNYINGSFRNIS